MGKIALSFPFDFDKMNKNLIFIKEVNPGDQTGKTFRINPNRF